MGVFDEAYSVLMVSLIVKKEKNLKKSSYHIVGVMSGTSLDGIDLCEIDFEFVQGKWKFEIKKCETVPYSPFWKKELQQAVHFSKEQLERLNFKYTEKLSDDISGFIRKNHIREIDAVCSHGHTVLHQPEKGLTYQIGNLPRISKSLGLKVVCNFRIQDVKLGGQGAPLVPIGDLLLFPEYDYCLNLGGFANCSFQRNGERIAYDISPANIVLNHYAEKLGHDFDNGGAFAEIGILNSDCLQKLNSLSYYSHLPPKSLGLEWVKENIFPLLDSFHISSEDILRTFTEHIAMQLARQFRNGTSVLITGGGAYNSFLIDRLKKLGSIDVIIPSPKIIEYKEALIFGLLGVLKLRGETNCLASVTGASKDHSSGKIFFP